MTVYILFAGCKYEGGGVIGVYATPEAALPQVEELLKDWKQTIDWCEKNYRESGTIQKDGEWKWMYRSDYISITPWEVQP